MSDGPCETPLSDHVSRALSLMATGGWFLRLTHPNPAEGSSSFGTDVAEAIAARLAKAERERDDLRHDVERHIAASSSEAGSADAAEAKLAKAERALEEAEKVIANERSRATDAEYMAQAYRNMLGDIGMKVADMWRDKGVRRVHFSWSGEAEKLTGEERAKHILEWEYAPSREVDPREIDGASPTVSVEEFVSGMESLPSPPKEG